MDKGWREAIITVLKASDSAMHYTSIAEEIITRKLRKSVGATPASTVNAILTSDLKKNGDLSLFVRVNPGEFMLRPGLSATTQETSSTQDGEEEEPEPRMEEELGIIQAFGMFWRRDFVQWSSTATKLLGQQQQGAQRVDFSRQIGVYLLHDGRQVIYVGRAKDRPLSRRLYEHTYDRLNGRWDRFSWFGLLRVTPEGELVEPSWSNLNKEHLLAAILATVEAVLIEGLEPPQNRKRGDEFKGVEYLQVKDDRLEKQGKSALIQEFNDWIRSR